MRNFEFLFWAYNSVWLLLAAYVSYVLFRLDRAERQVQRLEEKLSGRKIAGGREGAAG